jgi:hypothetical protein
MRVGHRDVSVEAFNTSNICGWQQYGLDMDDRGNSRNPGALYLEALKA